MASAYDVVELARAYAMAGDQLVEPALNSLEAWRISDPIFFLYRHAVELYLKAIVKPPKPGHNLTPLIKALDELLRKRDHTGLPADLKRDLLVFAAIDPKAQGFRYSTEPSGARQLLQGEYWVTLRDLREFMEELFTFLEGAFREIS